MIPRKSTYTRKKMPRLSCLTKSVSVETLVCHVTGIQQNARSRQLEEVRKENRIVV
jgi:hypothetical protein